jgi:hypothetical protein
MTRNFPKVRKLKERTMTCYKEVKPGLPKNNRLLVTNYSCAETNKLINELAKSIELSSYWGYKLISCHFALQYISSCTSYLWIIPHWNNLEYFIIRWCGNMMVNMFELLHKIIWKLQINQCILSISTETCHIVYQEPIGNLHANKYNSLVNNTRKRITTIHKDID